MTIFTAHFPTVGRTATRESEARYTHAAAHNDGAGKVTFHKSFDAAKRAVGRKGIIVRVSDDAPVAAKPAVDAWHVYDAAGVRVGTYDVPAGANPFAAIKAARDAGHAAARARRA